MAKHVLNVFGEELKYVPPLYAPPSTLKGLSVQSNSHKKMKNILETPNVFRPLEHNVNPFLR
jgi:hypothetical protein